ncbi:MAG: glutathione synthase [Gammaproteobacteria bacterium]|nr:MAG: glutathione synthase [Gammaproteobacteria bacterium]
MRIGIIVNALRTEKAGYTTTRLAMLAARRGHEVFYIDLDAFALRPDDHVYAHAWPVPPRRRRSTRLFLAEMQSLEKRVEIDLHTLDVLLPRSDPSAEIHRRPWARMAAIHFSRLVRRAGVLVLNDPDGLDLGLTKLYLEHFPESIRPRTLVTRDFDEARDFIAEQGGYAVIKPLAGSGGRNVFVVRPHDTPNVNQMLEAVSRDHYFIVQEYLRDAVHGDTRVFMLNGRPFVVRGRLAAVHRQRRVGDADIRSNLTAGAIAVKAEVTEALLAVAEATGERLRRDGIFFAGLDVVGDRVMEINVQTPGGLPAAEHFEGVDFTAALLDAIERKVAWARAHPGGWTNAELAVAECA